MRIHYVYVFVGPGFVSSTKTFTDFVKHLWYIGQGIGDRFETHFRAAASGVLVIFSLIMF